MHTEEHSWHSPRLERDMTLKAYGHWGQPFIVFPCSRGRYFDYEGNGHGGGHRPRSSTAAASSCSAWTASMGTPGTISACRRPNAMPATNDTTDILPPRLVPFIRNHCNDEHLRVMTNGLQHGCLACRQFFPPTSGRFAGTIAMSGLYRLDRPEFGIGADNLAAVYTNSPVSYLPGLSDPWYLDRYRESTIIIAVGQGAWEEEALADTRALDHIFREKGIGAWIDYWGYDVNHDWPLVVQTDELFFGATGGIAFAGPFTRPCFLFSKGTLTSSVFHPDG